MCAVLQAADEFEQLARQVAADVARGEGGRGGGKRQGGVEGRGRIQLPGGKLELESLGVSGGRN